VRPGPLEIQSEKVKAKFELEKFAGTYYELALHDITQYPVCTSHLKCLCCTFPLHRLFTADAHTHHVHPIHSIHTRALLSPVHCLPRTHTRTILTRALLASYTHALLSPPRIPVHTRSLPSPLPCPRSRARIRSFDCDMAPVGVRGKLLTVATQRLFGIVCNSTLPCPKACPTGPFCVRSIKTLSEDHTMINDTWSLGCIRSGPNPYNVPLRFNVTHTRGYFDGWSPVTGKVVYPDTVVDYKLTADGSKYASVSNTCLHWTGLDSRPVTLCFGSHDLVCYCFRVFFLSFSCQRSNHATLAECPLLLCPSPWQPDQLPSVPRTYLSHVERVKCRMIRMLNDWEVERLGS
jgi:hypothetical protein